MKITTNRHLPTLALALAIFPFVASSVLPLSPLSAEETGKANKEDPIDKLKRLFDKSKKGLGYTGGLNYTPKPGGAHGKSDPHAKLNANRLVRVALQHLAEGRKKEAIMSLDSAIKKFPDSEKLYGVRGSIYMQEKQYSLALSDFERAVKIKPDNPLLLVSRAQAYRKFKRFDAAMKDFDKAIRIAPDLVAARFNRGALLFYQGKIREAATDFEHSASINPHAAGPRFNLAIAHGALGDPDKAIAEMKQFLKISKNEKSRKIAQNQIKLWQKLSRVVKESRSKELADGTQIAPTDKKASK